MKRVQLTWDDANQRWKKFRGGKQYYFPLKPGETRESSYARCLREWEVKKTELDREAARSITGSYVAASIAPAAELWCERYDASLILVEGTHDEGCYIEVAWRQDVGRAAAALHELHDLLRSATGKKGKVKCFSAVDVL